MPETAPPTQPPTLARIRTTTDLRTMLAEWRQEGKKVGFVPTMGALHDGHLSLIDEAKAHADRVIVSLFVNPKQFGPNEDFGAYPRTEDADAALVEARGGDAVFIPPIPEMYPEGYQTKVLVPELANCLDGTSRPGFFDGIATVVTKLFNLVSPDIAVFGEKDFQQLMVIRQMVKDLNMPIEVIGAPIIREADGLAMSSRNRYLSPEERKIAGQLNQIMGATIADLRSGTGCADALKKGRHALERAGLAPIDYLEVRQLPQLTLPESGPLAQRDWAQSRLFAAVMLGKTRLIDNMSVAENT